MNNKWNKAQSMNDKKYKQEEEITLGEDTRVRMTIKSWWGIIVGAISATVWLTYLILSLQHNLVTMTYTNTSDHEKMLNQITSIVESQKGYINQRQLSDTTVWVINTYGIKTNHASEDDIRLALKQIYSR